MNRWALVTGINAFGAFVIASVVLGQTPDAAIGTWKLNLAKSSFGASPAPKNEIYTIQPSKDGFKAVTNGVSVQGQVIHREAVVKFDGKEYPDPTVQNATRAYKPINARTYEVVFKKNGKVSATSKVVISEDGKTRTVTELIENDRGQSATNIRVYDKQ